ARGAAGFWWSHVLHAPFFCAARLELEVEATAVEQFLFSVGGVLRLPAFDIRQRHDLPCHSILAAQWADSSGALYPTGSSSHAKMSAPRHTVEFSPALRGLGARPALTRWRQVSREKGMRSSNS